MRLDSPKAEKQIPGRGGVEGRAGAENSKKQDLTLVFFCCLNHAILSVSAKSEISGAGPEGNLDDA